MSSKQPRVVIGIPTFKRPIGLRRLLESLANLETSVTPTVLVVDNDAQGQQGMQVVQALQAEGYRWPLKAVMESERGISQARNKLLQEGFGELKADFLAMVDDDTWVEPQWLQALLNMQAQTGADVVGGNAKPEFPGAQPDWTKGLEVYWDDQKPKGGVVGLINTTTAVLLKREMVFNSKLMFDNNFSKTGGGDKDFFIRCQKLGSVFAFADNSVVNEMFDNDRLQLIWSIRRSYRYGMNEYQRYQKYHQPIMPRFLKSLAGIGKNILLMPFSKNIVINFTKISWNLGFILALLMKPYNEYNNTYGQ